MPLRLIHVGLGGWGSNWAEQVVAHNKDVETVAWVEIVEEVLNKVQERLHLPKERCFTSLDDALKSYEADAVLITASLPGHVPSALTALRADKHVLLEKPFAPTLAEAQQVVNLAEERGRILMISQNYRFYSAVRVVADLVKTQELGRVGAVSLDFRRYANSAPVEGNRHYKLWHPLLADMSIHHFDLMRAVLGQEPVRVECKTWNPPWSNFVEPPTAFATISFDGGAILSYRGSWISTAPQTNWSGEWHMECERGDIEWTSRGELPEKVTLRPLRTYARSVLLPELKQEDRAGSLQAFVQAVRTGAEPATSGRDNLKTLALLYSIIESAESGQPVNIPNTSA